MIETINFEKAHTKFGWIVFPITLSANNNKKVVKPPKNWSNLKKSNYIEGFDHGIRTGKDSNLIVIDFDVKDGPEDSINAFNSFYKRYPTFTVKTGSGGYHMYFKYTSLLKKNNTTNALKIDGQKIAIDLRGDGGFIISPESMHPVAQKPYEIILDSEPAEFPKQLIELFNCGECDAKLNPIINVSEEQATVSVGNNKELRQYLDLITDWDGYDRWLSLGVIIFNISGDINLWLEYSKKSKHFNQSELETKWSSFKSDKKEKLGWRRLFEFCQADNKEGFDKLRGMSFTNKKPPISEFSLEALKGGENSALSLEFMKHFIVCFQGGKNYAYHRNLDPFNNLIWDKFAITQRTEEDLKGLWNINYALRVDQIVLEPSEPPTYMSNKIRYLNIYEGLAWSLPKLQDFVIENGLNEKVNAWVKNHLFNVICGGQQADYDWLYNFIGNCLFNREFKPPIWPILYSKITGTGKSTFIKKIFQQFMGQAFSIKDDSEFAGKGALSALVGKTFILVDELHIETSNNYNKLKTLISEPIISYEKKYVDTINVKNFTNGIITTNHTNPIKNMANNDRRFCQFNLNAELTKGVGYFDIFNEPWQYFTYFFRDYNPKFRAENYKTKFNSENIEIKLNSLELFTKYVIAEYSSFPVHKGYKYTTTGAFFNKFKEMGGNTQQATFKFNLAEYGVIEKSEAPIRITVDKVKYTIYRLRDVSDIIASFKMRNSGLNPIDYEMCGCGSKAVIKCEEHGKLCYECKKKCECLNQTIYGN